MNFSNEALAHFFAQHIDGIIVVDQAGIVLYANAAAETLFGRPGSALVGQVFGYPLADDVGEIEITRGDDILWAEMRVTEVEHAGERVILVALRDVTARRRAETEMRIQARTLAEMQNAAVITDAQGAIIYWNRFAEQLFGWPLSEVLGRNMVEIVTPPGYERTYEILERLQRGETWAGDFLSHQRDGTPFFAFVSCTPVFDERGQLTNLVGVATDISVRRRAEDRLAQRHRALQAIHEVAQHISLEEEIGATFRRILTRALEVLDAVGGLVLVHDPEADVLRTVESSALPGAIDLTIARGEGVSGRVLATRRPVMVNDYAHWDQHVTSFDTTGIHTMLGVPLLWQGRVLGVLAIFNRTEGRVFMDDDIELAELFAAQAALALTNVRLLERVRENVVTLQQQRLSAILHNIEEAIVLTDLEGTVIYTNRAFTDLLGYEFHELSGQPVSVLKNPALPLIFAAAVEGTPWQGEIVLACKKHRPHEIELAVVPVPGAGGEVAGVVASLRDIGRYKQLDRMKTRFMQHISHELRTPLSNILMNAYLLREDHPHDQRVAQVDRLEQQTRRLIALTEKVLDATQLAGLDEMQRDEDVNLANWLDQAITRCHIVAEAKGVTLRTDQAADVPYVLPGDSYWLGRALVEILENAIYYTESGGAVTVAVRRVRDEPGRNVPRLAVDVIDTGTGINAEDLDQILHNDFYRGALSESSPNSGIGLGLTIARLVLEHHGGALAAHSVPGHGATFTLLLPLS